MEKHRHAVLSLKWLSLFSLALSKNVLAYSGQSTKIDTVLKALLDYLTSTPARIVAVLAIISVGYATLHLGRMPKQKAIAVVVGIGIIFGGSAVLQMLGVGE